MKKFDNNVTNRHTDRWTPQDSKDHENLLPRDAMHSVHSVAGGINSRFSTVRYVAMPLKRYKIHKPSY